MHLMTSPHPMTVANQHWVLVPEADLDDPSTTYRAQAVYAPTPEAAVELIRDLYRIGNYGETREPESLTKIRVAQGAELPWNSPECTVTVVGKGEAGKDILVDGMDHETILFCYGNDVTIRKATPAEAEPVIRANTCERDKEDEEQFNYGFNVLYKEQLENGDFQ